MKSEMEVIVSGILVLSSSSTLTPTNLFPVNNLHGHLVSGYRVLGHL